MRFGILYILFLLCFCLHTKAQDLLFVELNCENLFDCEHDSLKQDKDFCEGGYYHWTKGRMWKKLNNIGREIISCGGEGENWKKPDLVALIEVENDSVLTWLTRRSCLKKAGYKYVMTDSPDARGIDVALLYDSLSFRVENTKSIRIPHFGNHKATRDILVVQASRFQVPDSMFQVSGSKFQDYGSYLPLKGDGGSLFVFVCHLPSRRGGEKASAPYRNFVSDILCHAIDSVRGEHPDAGIIVTGDFNDYYDNLSVSQIENHGMKNVSAKATGRNGAKGTYRYQGEWGSLDQILVSKSWMEETETVDCHVNDAPFLVVEDKKYGGVKPRRVYTGPSYDAEGFSDHLPLVMEVGF